jgi:hypothetical protein
VTLAPSLADIQRTVNRTAAVVLHSFRGVWEWGQLGVPDPDVASFVRRGVALGSGLARPPPPVLAACGTTRLRCLAVSACVGMGTAPEHVCVGVRSLGFACAL